MTPEEISQIDARLAEWRQGDVVLDAAMPAIHLADISIPGTPEAEQLARETTAVGEPLGLAVVSTDFPGFMIVSQTCDIVRTCATREFVEVCPLVTLPEDKLRQVRAGRIPRYLTCSGLDTRPMAADLDRLTTVEKRTLIQFDGGRIRGVFDDSERRRLASALARKRARAALPDDFVAFVAPLQRRIKERHGRNSSEGKFLSAAREIRVSANPGWIGERIEISLIFIFNKIDEIPEDTEVQLSALTNLILEHPKYTLSSYARALDEISAATYLGSDALDLDALSDG
ncbi:hypothetical protein [Xanthobacter autotrophicus]|uniref:hypothetical protein n=1 Tax=Xanthobacter autotrophicus TaxID=280 RepID=UPI0024A6F0BF|nr:hypothetical protein [Xanthobacter autotrophicus]MDI4655520.1 hypothetical protein [Xanthobacter autotrophicus]